MKEGGSRVRFEGKEGAQKRAQRKFAALQEAEELPEMEADGCKQGVDAISASSPEPVATE